MDMRTLSTLPLLCCFIGEMGTLSAPKGGGICHFVGCYLCLGLQVGVSLTVLTNFLGYSLWLLSLGLPIHTVTSAQL